jgi:hypothetical protein
MDTGYRYGVSQVGHQWDINGVDNVGVCYRYGIWAHDTRDDSIDAVISHLDMECFVALVLQSFGTGPGVRGADGAMGA